MPNLRLLSEQAREMYDHFEALEPEEFLKAMQEIEQKGMQYVAPLCDLMDEYALRAETRTSLAKRYSELASADLNRIENIKKSILFIMQACGQKKLDNGPLQVTVNAGRESLEVFDEAVVPLKYKKAVIEIPAEQLEPARLLFGDDIKKETITVSKTMIKDEIKAYAAEHDGQSLGVAGTQIVKKPYLVIKG